MTLESAYQIATIVIALTAFVKYVIPRIKKIVVNWWNKIRDRTEFILGYKTKSRQEETHSAEYTIGYLFICYKTSNRKAFIHWKYIFLDSFYRWIAKIYKFENLAITKSMNNFIKFVKERSKTTDGSSASYIYKEERTLAFYPIKEFNHSPSWTRLPYVEREIYTYFKCYETKKQNQYDLRNGERWMKSEELDSWEWLGIARVNVNHNQDPLMPESKKIIKLLKKGFKKQFVVDKIGHIVCIKRRTVR